MCSWSSCAGNPPLPGSAMSDSDCIEIGAGAPIAQPTRPSHVVGGRPTSSSGQAPRCPERLAAAPVGLAVLVDDGGGRWWSELSGLDDGVRCLGFLENRRASVGLPSVAEHERTFNNMRANHVIVTGLVSMVSYAFTEEAQQPHWHRDDDADVARQMGILATPRTRRSANHMSRAKSTVMHFPILTLAAFSAGPLVVPRPVGAHGPRASAELFERIVSAMENSADPIFKSVQCGGRRQWGGAAGVTLDQVLSRWIADHGSRRHSHLQLGSVW